MFKNLEKGARKFIIYFIALSVLYVCYYIWLRIHFKV